MSEDCFSWTVFLMECGCWSPAPFSEGVMVWSAVCDRGISWSYSLFSANFHQHVNIYCPKLNDDAG